MRLIRKGKGTRSLGSGHARCRCYGGPLDGEHVMVADTTQEFFSVEPTDVALSPDDLLPVWRYTRDHGLRRFIGHRDTEL